MITFPQHHVLCSSLLSSSTSPFLHYPSPLFHFSLPAPPSPSTSSLLPSPPSPSSSLHPPLLPSPPSLPSFSLLCSLLPARLCVTGQTMMLGWRRLSRWWRTNCQRTASPLFTPTTACSILFLLPRGRASPPDMHCSVSRRYESF